MIITDFSTINCECRKVHVPKYLTTEYHHIIPQSWQKFWTPWNPKPIQSHWEVPDEELGNYAWGVIKPWDPRTTELCRTCHGNVHYCLVAMMKVHDVSIWASELRSKAAYVKGLGLPRAESDIAYRAMERFHQAGGDLSMLTAARLWGQI